MIATTPVISEVPPIIAVPSRTPALLYRALAFPLKFVWGMLLCQSLLGSILVVGWSYRLAQRAALKFWWSRRAAPGRGLTLDQFLSASERTKPHQHWPNWFLHQNFREAMERPERRAPALRDSTLESVSGKSSPSPPAPRTLSGPEERAGERRSRRSAPRLPFALIHSLSRNFWTGLRAITNTWVLTLPACLFWWFGWYDGWNNSFNKGYEQAPFGPLISIFGIVLFIAAMFYVPLAQARQAVTGDWRSFFQFRLVWRIVRARWISSVALALLYSLFALPLNVLKTSPTFQPVANPALANLTDAQVLKHLDSYFFFCAIVMLPAYVILRLLAARIYASGILALLQTAKIQPAELAPLEFETLQRLNLLEARLNPSRHFFVHFITWTTTRVGRIASAFALALIWFTFVAQLYVTEFLQYHSGLGWMNQPLVQLPWFHYVPARLKSPWSGIAFAILVWLLASAIAKATQAFRSRRSQD